MKRIRLLNVSGKYVTIQFKFLGLFWLSCKYMKHPFTNEKIRTRFQNQTQCEKYIAEEILPKITLIGEYDPECGKAKDSK